MLTTAVSVDGLRRSYGAFEAVRGIDLEIKRGEIFALLGPNGAGKTTTLEILEGFRERSGGDVEVLGVYPERGRDLAILAAWGLCGFLIALTRLRWSPAAAQA